MGLMNPPDSKTDPVEYFRMFTESPHRKSLLLILVEETNRYTDQYTSNHPKTNSRTHESYETDTSNMAAFLCLHGHFNWHCHSALTKSY